MSSALSPSVLSPAASERSLHVPRMTSTLGVAALLGVVHLVVDATTVSVALRASNLNAITPRDAFTLVVAYDVLAFGSQVFLGIMVDRCWRPASAMRLGLALTIGSVIGTAIHPILALLLAGVGNALFHLGAGAMVLSRGLKRAMPAGVFVAPGALGLAFGLMYGRLPDLGPLWPLAFVSAIGLVCTWLIQLKKDTSPLEHQSRALSSLRASSIRWALTLLLLSIAVRSLVGLSATRGLEPSPLLLFGVPLVACAGKGLGGYAADHLGWLRTSLGALLLSGPFILFGASSSLLLLLGLLLFQMTMPVTLTAAAQLMPQSLATAFGWTCFALIIGALPTMFSPLAAICTRPALLGWIVIGAISVGFGLRHAEHLRDSSRLDESNLRRAT